MSTYGNATPYNAVYGRQPSMLPPIASEAGDSADGRKEQRIRQAALSSMTQVNAMSLTNRALNSKTYVDGAKLYKPGDLVDYHRPPSDKDSSGWHGPVPVVRNKPEA